MTTKKKTTKKKATKRLTKKSKKATKRLTKKQEEALVKAQQERAERQAACHKDILDVLERHKCELQPVMHLVGGSEPVGQVNIIAK